VNERWVCKRCFADNEEADANCRQCGLVRGADLTEADRATWAVEGTPATAGRTPSLQGWLRFWWVPALAIFLVIGYLVSARRDDAGSISGGGTLSIEDLRVGDCFNSEETDEISSVDARPCTEAHQYEMFHIATWAAAGEYPSEDAMVGFVIDECIPAFEAYVGRSFQASQLDFVHFVPVEEGWAAGDRVFQCAMFDPAVAELSQSLRDTRR
jgi:hypothetical protein